MKKIRINNDIDIVVELKDEAGEVMHPQSLRNIAVVLSTSLKKHKVEDFTLLSNGVGFRFKASEQARTGVYNISVTAETADGRAFATDVCKAFELVACSCEAGGEAGEVEVESVNVAATFAITAFAGADFIDLGEMSPAEIIKKLEDGTTGIFLVKDNTSGSADIRYTIYKTFVPKGEYSFFATKLERKGSELVNTVGTFGGDKNGHGGFIPIQEGVTEEYVNNAIAEAITNTLNTEV